MKPENQPWTRWWWMGSALDEAEITRHLTLFHEANIGGVEISPIYGVKGYESRWVSFLSPRWVELLGFTIREAKKLGMGVDLIAGTGWPFGGPWVGEEDAARRFVWEVLPVGGARTSVKTPEAVYLASSPPDADGHVLSLFLGHTKQQVKRAAPGGDGNVLDHLSGDSIRHYFGAFDQALAALPNGEMVRCFFNDSWEVYGANATPAILDEFRKRRGYDPVPHLRALKGGKNSGDPDLVRRVRSDYRETVADIVRDEFLGNFNAFAHGKGAKTRNQSHGSPGNLLDIYGAADIPETEVFGPIRLTLGGLTAPRPVTPDFGEEEELLICKMASSAAHVMGKPLCSSESFTWLGEHGCVPLEHAKAEVDLLLTMGINHIFFHGTPLSPADAPWPGWLFYATTLCAPTNTWWKDFGALNAYITRCQTTLQGTASDNDLLVYLPFYDLIGGEAGATDDLMFMSFHKTGTWLRGNLPEFCAASRELWKLGYGFDFVSDRQLTHEISASDGKLAARNGGAKWKGLLIAGCRTMPPETLERIAELAHSGVPVYILGDLPEDVPGLSDLEARRKRLAKSKDTMRNRVHSGLELSDLRARLGEQMPGESLAQHGLEYIRRKINDTVYLYFVSNPTRTDFDGFISLSVAPLSYTLTDPMTGQKGLAETKLVQGHPHVRLKLPAGSAMLLHAGEGVPNIGGWHYDTPDTASAQPLAGEWKLEFVEGGPSLPAARTLPALADWTTLSDGDHEALRAFSGTVRYTHTFDAPANVKAHERWFLDLGQVCHSARVRLNGTDLGTVLARPWHVAVPASLLKPTGNRLEIEVTNLMGNRLADLERKEGDKWRPFLLVNILYKPFDAASWEPIPSGLLGPVRLLPGVDSGAS